MEMKYVPDHPELPNFANHASGNNVDLWVVRLPLQTSWILYQPPRQLFTPNEPTILFGVVNGVSEWRQDEGQFDQRSHIHVHAS